MADTLLVEKKSLTKNVDKGTDEFSDKILSVKKSSTTNVDKGTDELANTLFINKKFSTKDVDKGTDVLVFMAQKVNTILRKGLDQFEVQSIVSKGWFKRDI